MKNITSYVKATSDTDNDFKRVEINQKIAKDFKFGTKKKFREIANQNYCNNFLLSKKSFVSATHRTVVWIILWPLSVYADMIAGVENFSSWNLSELF